MYALYKIPINAVDNSPISQALAYTTGKEIAFVYPAAEKLTKQEFAGVLEHEITHVLNLHIERGRGKERLRWNLAIDIVVNGGIRADEANNEKAIVAPRYGVFSKTVEHLAAEEVYKLLEDNSVPNIKELPDGRFEYTDEETGRKAIFEPDIDFSGIGDSEIEKMGRDLLRDSRNVHFGKDPKGIERVALDLLDRVRVDWKKEIKRFISSRMQDYSFSSRDRRFMSHPLFIPGLADTIDGSIEIGVGIDLSGSISEKDIQKMLTECIGIQKAYPVAKFTFIPFDVDTYGQFPATGKAGVMKAFTEFQGGGGTSFVKVLSELEAIKGIKIILMMTDLYGTFPKKKPKVPILWLDLLGSYKEPVPYGRVILYDKD